MPTLNEVDIRQLAIVREVDAAPKLRRRRHFVTRYLLPSILVAGFLALIGVASRDIFLPPRDVWVVPVLASQSSVQQGGAPLFQAAGWIEPRPTQVRVAALAPGVVERLLVVEDQRVQVGEPVAELIKDDARLAYERAQASARLREAEVKQAQAALQAATTRLNQPVHLEATLGEAEADLAAIATELTNLPYQLRRAEADLSFAKKNYEGKKAAGEAIATREIDLAESALRAAQALVEELSSRKASLESQQTARTRRRDALKTQLLLLADETKAKDEADAMLQAAVARLEQERVVLAEAKLRLDRMTVRSPIDGRVYELVGYPGTTLTGGMSPTANADGSTVVTLYRPEILQVRVDVRFQDIPKVSLGQPVQINNPALENPLTGKVLFVSSEADIQKNTLGVKVAIDSPPEVLKPEMLVDVTFLAPKSAATAAEASEETRLYVPQQLIFQDEAGAYVWLADRSSGTARKVRVTTGRSAAGGLVQISSGVNSADRVLARGHDGLTDGDHIRIVDEEPDYSAGATGTAGGRQTQHRLPPGGN
jgi:RND family efflux transporter MFP subunit